MSRQGKPGAARPRMPRVIEKQKDLEELCRELASQGAFALDTEFVRERTFFIQLGIVQVSAGAAFLIAYGYSVIDGFLGNKARVSEKRSERPIPRATSRVEILPFVPSSDGVGAQAVWRF